MLHKRVFLKKIACNDQDHHPDYEPEAETRHHVKQRQSRSSNRTSSGTSASHGKYAIILVYVENFVANQDVLKVIKNNFRRKSESIPICGQV